MSFGARIECSCTNLSLFHGLFGRDVEGLLPHFYALKVPRPLKKQLIRLLTRPCPWSSAGRQKVSDVKLTRLCSLWQDSSVSSHTANEAGPEAQTLSGGSTGYFRAKECATRADQFTRRLHGSSVGRSDTGGCDRDVGTLSPTKVRFFWQRLFGRCTVKQDTNFSA